MLERGQRARRGQCRGSRELVTPRLTEVRSSSPHPPRGRSPLSALGALGHGLVLISSGQVTSQGHTEWDCLLPALGLTLHPPWPCAPAASCHPSPATGLPSSALWNCCSASGSVPYSWQDRLSRPHPLPRGRPVHLCFRYASQENLYDLCGVLMDARFPN